MTHTATPEVIDIRIGRDGERRAFAHDCEVTVECVDGREYSKKFDNDQEAWSEAKHLIAIVPAWGWKEAK